MTSAIPGFFKLSIEDRLKHISGFCDLSDEDQTALRSIDLCLNDQTCETMIENFITRHVTPIGVATNFIIDGKDRLIPYATEEPSVIAGASFAAKLARPSGGFTTAAGQNICSGQTVFLSPSTNSNAKSQLESIIPEIIEVSNSTMPSMIKRNCGTEKVNIKEVETESGNMIIVELHISVGDSMGANCVTQACEAVKTYIQKKLGLEPLMGILTNLSSRRIVYAQAKWRISDLGSKSYDGYEVANRIIMAANLAKVDPYRAATHRKGIMNGISAVVSVTGNDTRAVESAIHSYASLEGSNPALTQFRIVDQELIGEIRLPIPVGTVGGSINRNSAVKTFRKMMKVETANELARVIAAVGLAQNFAALRALVTQGICEGHMKLHSRNIACEAGAVGDDVEKVAQKLVQTGAITVTNAKEVLRQLHCQLT
ncbi:hydroxymethylglutaryl-CoA reductase, degradative [Histomonas meleagridis]|uniref:hydroxymethylglutaryl-CoA reductase, degradative n=1 Tax=Histomonas meleagridis TaxID=135588 RepID=UPI00355A8481|nr:hydroxymethylglutaryl-CoA reductase, degradative [Histomonas meleagridis]KAH0807153.1 hydroxymethylglutaryl-CoA reductase, degradative [Histomonas meleagridis]